MIDHIESSINHCYRCAIACERCISAAQLSSEQESMYDCLRLAAQCAALCRLTAQCVSEDSKAAVALYPICAAACRACAVECEKYSLLSCSYCAQICRQSAAAFEAAAAQAAYLADDSPQV
ncbi:four-helix bundle copper-binding protein [Mixta tenebrionis]|uniref:Four-helix bundle copper-binding protein n=1 Tax=Mixta tenebrionis TaxID=2562439 RepID=A0A506VG09_9GAMM|nr:MULTISPECIES: four-helix bundle copper-binding protein [Mixta]QHM75811.1 putative cysteine-rich protein YhjQ [Mixta theicola]TPW44346.1 four-helix bundle copper-binding protein [Mixta tenebrionis]